MPAVGATIWNRDLRATRLNAHVVFAAVVWPVLTIIGTAFALAALPYYSVPFDQAIAASSLGAIVGDRALVT